LLQERRVGRHILPENVFIIAAGNTVEDGAIAYEMGTALSDRLIHLHMRADARDWVETYAAPRGFAPAITAFLQGRPDLLDTTELALRRGEMIACTPRSWERASQIMTHFADRPARNAMLAGTLGDAVAAEFIVIADDIAATLNIAELLRADAKSRHSLYPDTLHGLNALVFGLIGAADKDTMPAVIQAMEQIRHLADKRDPDRFRRLPLAELTTFGFELLMAKALAQNLTGAFATSDAYKRYADDRKASGLE
jgi:hypothetical protein